LIRVRRALLTNLHALNENKSTSYDLPHLAEKTRDLLMLGGKINSSFIYLNPRRGFPTEK